MCGHLIFLNGNRCDIYVYLHISFVYYWFYAQIVALHYIKEIKTTIKNKIAIKFEPKWSNGPFRSEIHCNAVLVILLYMLSHGMQPISFCHLKIVPLVLIELIGDLFVLITYVIVIMQSKFKTIYEQLFYSLCTIYRIVARVVIYWDFLCLS